MEPETAPAGSPNLVKFVFFNDRGLRAGWRLLIYVGIIAVCNLLIRLLLSLLASKSQRPVLPYLLTP